MLLKFKLETIHQFRTNQGNWSWYDFTGTQCTGVALREVHLYVTIFDCFIFFSEYIYLCDYFPMSYISVYPAWVSTLVSLCTECLKDIWGLG